jgi:pimeloyl-ACP methyl ester carboxylesterase
VDGVRLHYTDRGAGQPIVLIHGNAVTGSDYDTSGVSGQLLGDGHRVIVFDRPGFGHRERPRWRLWTATQQAELLHKALKQLGIERPVVVGHSWGTIVALSLAARHPADTAGLVLLSGYYFWTLRPDVLLVAAGAIPVLGDILRYTVSPWLGRLLMPLQKRAMFSPAPVTARFKREYSDAMALRPSQIRATSVDGALTIPGALGLRRHYDDLRMPVLIMGGGRRQGRPQAQRRAPARRDPGQRPADRRRGGAHGPPLRAAAGRGGHPADRRDVRRAARRRVPRTGHAAPGRHRGTGRSRVGARRHREARVAGPPT